jgi:hypothetical protein
MLARDAACLQDLEEWACPRECGRHRPDCEHVCRSRCHAGGHPRCTTLVDFRYSDCEHSGRRECTKKEPICSAPCGKITSCGHPCQRRYVACVAVVCGRAKVLCYALTTLAVLETWTVVSACRFSHQVHGKLHHRGRVLRMQRRSGGGAATSPC